MIIRSQNGIEFDIYTVETEGNCVYCQDNADRRRKRLLGKYSSISKATEVFKAILRCVDGYFQMPSDEEVEV